MVTLVPSGSAAVCKNYQPIVVSETEKTIVGLSLLSAIIIFFFLKPISHDGMVEEDRKVRVSAICALHFLLNSFQFREYLEENGYDTSLMGIGSSESQIETASVTEKKSDE